MTALNQLLKCISLRSFHALNRVKYSAKLRTKGGSYSRNHVVSEVQFFVRGRGWNTRVPADRKPRMLWIGALENQDRGGLLQALENHFEVEVFKNSHGGYGLLGVGPVPPDYSAETVMRLNVETLTKYLGGNGSEPKYDILFGQMWAPLLNPVALSTAQARGVFVVNIAMDDALPIHWITRNGIRNGAIGLSPGVDLTLTTREDCARYYFAEGAMALPWNLGSSSDLFGKFSAVSSRPIDVSFVGNRYGVRGKIVSTLVEAGVSVSAWGLGWPNGVATAAQSAEIFGKSKIVLGISTVGQCRNFPTMKLRDFDGPMSGALYLSQESPDLARMYDVDREIVTYRNAKDLLEKVTFYLANEEERLRIASAGQVRAKENYDWSKVIGDTFQQMGLLDQAS